MGPKEISLGESLKVVDEEIFARAADKSRKEAYVFFLPSSVDVQDLPACLRLFRRAIHQIEEIEGEKRRPTEEGGEGSSWPVFAASGG